VGHLLQGRFKAVLVEKETHLLELCRYVVLNPVRAKAVSHPRQWRWSSYRATVGEVDRPAYVTVDWVLGQFATQLHTAQERYRAFVAEGRGQPKPWDQLIGQIYLGAEDFVAKHQPDRVIRDIPRRQTQAQRPSLRLLFQRGRQRERVVHEAYRRYGYRLVEIAAHLGVHAATISRWLRRAEQENV
jgi:hypothetical protein